MPNEIPCATENMTFEIPVSDKLRLMVGDRIVVEGEECGGKGVGDDIEGEDGDNDGEDVEQIPEDLKAIPEFLSGPDVGSGGMRAGFGGPW